MFEQINDLTISGGCFREETKLGGIFQDRINIVYGPNGSGKSTISRAMADLAYDLKGEVNNSRGSATALFDDRQMNELRGRLYVFNEDFVDKNVKVEEGLDGIVMLGEKSIANDADKKRLDGEIKILQDERDTLIKERDGDADAGTKSLKDQINEDEDALKDSLKSDAGYAARGKNIKGQKNKIPVKLDDFYGIEKNPGGFDTNMAKVQKELSDGISSLANVQDGEKLTWKAPEDTGVDIDSIDRLLKKKIQKVELSDEWLQELAERSIETIETAQRCIVEKGLERCPYCQQPISNEWMEVLKENIRQVLNKDVEEFKIELDVASQGLLELYLVIDDKVEEKFGNEVKTLKLAINDWNKFVGSLRILLAGKKQNMYSEGQGIDRVKYADLQHQLNGCCKELNKKIDEHNQAVNDIKTRRAQLQSLNLWLGYLENKADFEKIAKLKAKQVQIEQDLNIYRTKIDKKQTELQRLNSGRGNKEEAMKIINECLNMIFFDSERLQLKESQDRDKYILTSRGQQLPPRNVSVGERNILALAYFYASLLEGTEEDGRYDVERFVVIDDPVSSFDKGNVLGVISLFRDMIEKLITEKQRWETKIKNNCKFLIMSHDRQTIKYFESIRDEYFNEIKTIELRNSRGEIRVENYNVWNGGYKEALTRILYFVTDNRFPDDRTAYMREYSGIGNEIRQSLETFAKLNYNSDCKRVLKNDYIWRNFYIERRKCENNEEYRERCDRVKNGLKRKLQRAVLNEYSHSATNIDTQESDHLIGFDELREIAKYFLVYMDCVANQHSFGYLRGGDNILDEKRTDIMNRLVNEVVNECCSTRHNAIATTKLS